jgi:hypothetical protein
MASNFRPGSNFGNSWGVVRLVTEGERREGIGLLMEPYNTEVVDEYLNVSISSKDVLDFAY